MPWQWKDVEKLMHYWAGNFQDRRFEHWELINAVWLRGRVQNVDKDDISITIKRDMIDYMRRVSKQRRTKNGKFYRQEYNFTDQDQTLKAFPPQIKDNGLWETKEYFNDLTKDFTREDRLIIILRYVAGLTFPEIGKAIGQAIDEQNILYRHKKLLEKIARKLKKP